MKNKSNSSKSVDKIPDSKLSSYRKKGMALTADVGQFASELNREARKRSWSLKEIFLGFLGLAVTIALCVLTVIYWEEISGTGLVERYGLLGLFILAFMFSSALSAVGVVPYWIFTFTLSGILAETYGIWSPIWVGLTAATGATLGQSITFAIGYGGRELSKKLSSRFSPEFYDKAVGWMRKYGAWAVFFMSVTANPLHLPMTLAIASLRYPAFKFIIFGFAGQMVKSMVLSFSGYYGLNWLIDYITDPGDTVVIILLVIVGIIVLISLWQLIVWLIEIRDKTKKYRAALACAQGSGKPFLVGNPWGVKPFRRFFNKPAHGSGDVSLDIDRQALIGQEDGVVGTITHLPFADKAFGAVFFSHVLEHLPTATDAKQALEEMKRVADSVFIAYPSKQSIAGWIVRDHHLWVWQDDKCTYVQQRGKKASREKIVVETASKTTE